MGMTAVPTCTVDAHVGMHRNPDGGMPGVGWKTWTRLMDAMSLKTHYDDNDVFDTGHLNAREVLAVDVKKIDDEWLRRLAVALQADAILVAQCEGGRIALWG